MNEFILSDESKNSYGFYVRTAGINMDRFNKNPVMFYNHERKDGTIGRWEGLRIQDGKLYGTPVFDDMHEPGKTVKEKVEGGFLKGASMGIENCMFDGEICVSCNLLEVSVCDIPSNENAIQLYFKDKPVADIPTYLQLTMNNMDKELKPIFNVLGIPDCSTVNDAVAEIKKLKETSGVGSDTSKALKLAFDDGIISESERIYLDGVFNEKPEQLVSLLSAKRKDKIQDLSLEYDTYVRDNRDKFYTFNNEFIMNDLKSFALKDIKTFKKMMDKAQRPLKPIDLLNNTQTKDHPKLKAEWGLDEYRKYAPKELQNDPELYRRLQEKQNINIKS